MATQATTPSPEVICKAFVDQYYHLLNAAPDQVHKFYQDGSTIGRAGSDGVMEYVETLPEINKKIVSMDFSKYVTKLETADAVSLNGGALVVVTGSLTLTSDDVCQTFTQTFFLAPQESGYFVLNDILRLLPERNQENQKDGSVAVSDTTPAAVVERLTADPVLVENNVAGGELLNPTVNGKTVENKPTVNAITAENNVTVVAPVKPSKEDVKKTPVAASPPPAQKDIPKKHPISASPPSAQKDAIKKTYASIVKENKEVPPAVKPKIAKPVSKPPTKAVDGSAKPLQAAETTPASTSVTKSSTSHDEQGYSIFVKGLPFGSTVKMVGEEFKKFGAVKPDGIQVRNSKYDELCFGFVEFESQQSMQAAIEGSPIFIAEKKIIIEKKRTSTRVVNGVVTNGGVGGHFQYGRGAHNFRGQGGGYVNNAYYRGADHFNRRDDGGDHFNRRDDNHYNRRNDDGYFNTRNDFRQRGPHQGNGFHQPRPFQNANGGYARVNGPKQTPAADGPKQTPPSDGPKQTPAAA